MRNRREGEFFQKNETVNGDEKLLIALEKLKQIQESADNSLVKKIISALEKGYPDSAKVLCWNEADKFRSNPEAIKIIQNGLFSIQEPSPWGLSESQREERLDDEVFIESYKERFADKLDDAATKPGADNLIFPLEIGEELRNGEKILGSNDIEEVFVEVSKSFRLNSEEMNKLKDKFLK